jgi:signal transduction histidine kinase/ActR/RegA family two-component response regulator
MDVIRVPKTKPPERLPHYWSMVAVFIAMAILQASVAVFSIQMMSTVRAYVTGESLYSKGQKDAQIFLLDYADRFLEEDYQRFMSSLAMPLGDRAAREALQLPEPDVAAARQGFLDGGNHPDDVDGLIRMFRWFQHVPFMSKPIATWTEGDRTIQEMRALVDRARERILAGDVHAGAVYQMRRQAPVLNERLTQLTSAFSFQLGEASRTTQKLLLGLNAAIAALLALSGLLFVRRSARLQASAELRMEKARQNAEAERRTHEALEAASRAKTEFLSRMSHELRTPLNAVMGFSKLLRLDTARPLSFEQLERVQHVEIAAAHLLALVNDVLDLSRIESGEMSVSPEAVQLLRAVEEAATMVSPLVTEAGIEVFLSVEPSLSDAAGLDFHVQFEEAAEEIWVQADAVRLRQVLVNLLSNAVKYNKPGGSVHLTWRTVGHECHVVVVDTGRGIPDDQLASLFQPFNRLGAEASTVEGTGIGLVLSRQLAEMMGGSLEISSTFGEGTRACLTLQVATAPVSKADATPSQRSMLPIGRSLNVLYAEDNEVNAILVQQIVKLRREVSLRIAPNGSAALDMARTDPPDLMLVDMNLGDMTGIELARELRCDRSTRDIRLVALSADALPEQIRNALNSGFESYLTKPIVFEELLAILDKHSHEMFVQP